MSSVSVNPYTTLNPAQTVAKPKPAVAPEASKSPIVEGVSDFKAAFETAEKAAMQTAVSGADPHAMVEALANAEMVLDTAVTIRDKVVEAYQELLRMPV